jgi:hypothetical protein
MSVLLRLYPARWRARYGDEFAVLLRERPLGPFDVADVLLGALDAHLHLRGLGAASEHGKGFAMSLRIGGYAAILGGILWISGFLGAAVQPGDGNVWLWPALLFAGTAMLLVALIGLSAFQARRYPRLVWAAFAVPAVGGAVSLVGLYGMVTAGDEPVIGDLSGWYVWMLGWLALLVGSALFALATWRTHTLSRAAAALIGGAAITVLPLAAGATGGFVPDNLIGIFLGIAMAAFALGWAALGLSALRVDRVVHDALPGAAA